MTYIQEIHREITKSYFEGSRLSKYVHKLQECIQSACIMYTRESISNKSTEDIVAVQPKLNFDYQNLSKFKSEDRNYKGHQEQLQAQYSVRDDK